MYPGSWERQWLQVPPDSHGLGWKRGCLPAPSGSLRGGPWKILSLFVLRLAVLAKSQKYFTITDAIQEKKSLKKKKKES